LDRGRAQEVNQMAAIDPVCKMRVDEASAAAKSEYKGQVYYFCAKSCKERFDQNPQQYVK
jgi:YHS domain-containing protein